MTNCGWWPQLFVGVCPRCVLYKCCAGVPFRLVSGVWLPSSFTKNLTHDLTRSITYDGLTPVLSSDMSRYLTYGYGLTFARWSLTTPELPWHHSWLDPLYLAYDTDQLLTETYMNIYRGLFADVA